MGYMEHITIIKRPFLLIQISCKVEINLKCCTSIAKDESLSGKFRGTIVTVCHNSLMKKAYV